MLHPAKQLIIPLRTYATPLIRAMKQFAVIPDVVKVGPENALEITFKNNKHVELGNELTPEQVKDAPKVKWTTHDIQDAFVLCMVNPDSPDRKQPTEREWQHWLVGNIHENDIERAETLSEYIGPFPKEGSGFHRYVFLVYKQPKRIKFTEPHLKKTSVKNRTKFSILKFAEKYNLGNPIAGNIFQAQYDKYVPTLLLQIGVSNDKK